MNCYTLKMSDFLDCLLDNNLQSLNNDLQLWDQIINEFSDLRTNGLPNPTLELQKEIAVLDKKVEIIDLCVSVLWEMYNRNLANELQQMGFSIKLDWANKVSYYKELNSVISKAKKYIVLSKSKSKELDTMLKSNVAAKPTRKDFIKININLSKFMGFQISNANIFVAEWCELVNSYDEQIQNQLNKNLRRI